LKSSAPNDGITRLLHSLADALLVNTHEAAVPLANFSGDKDGLDMARIHEIHDGSWRIVQRPDVETIGPQDEDVRLFARAERADFAVEISTTGTLDGAEFEDLSTR